MIQGFYIVSYGLGIYLLNLLIGPDCLFFLGGLGGDSMELCQEVPDSLWAGMRSRLWTMPHCQVPLSRSGSRSGGGAWG
mgnify:CR=1 FL=1